MTESKKARRPAPQALAALKRAAQAALELARETGSGCYVERDGKIVDIAASKTRASKPRVAKRRGAKSNGTKPSMVKKRTAPAKRK